MSLELNSPATAHPMRSPVFWIRIAFSLGLLGWLASRIDWPNVSRGLLSAKPAWFALAACLLILPSALAALRWGLLMNRAGFTGITMSRWQSLYFAGNLINQGLPTIMGGDSFRAWQASRSHKAALVSSPDTPRFRLAVGVVIIDRSLGLIGNLMLGCLGLLSLGNAWLGLPAQASHAGSQALLRDILMAPWVSQLATILLALILGGLLLSSALLHWSRFNHFLRDRASAFHLKGLLPAAEMALGLRWLPYQLLLAISVHALAVMAMAACLYGVGVTPPISALMVTLPAIGILLLLPISISGWGIRESALAAMLSLWGVPEELTVLASVIFGLMSLLATLPGLPALLPNFRRDTTH